MSEQIQIQQRRHKHDEVMPEIDIPDNGASEILTDLQVSIEQLLGRVTYNLASNSV